MEQGACDLDRYIKLVTDQSKLVGTLQIKPVPSAASVTIDVLEAYLAGRNVHSKAIDRDAIENLCVEIRREPTAPHELVVARGSAAVNGNSVTYTLFDEVAQRIEIVQSRVDSIKDGLITEEVHHENFESEENAISFYNQMAFVIVHKDDRIAMRSERSEGIDGMDIFGISIPAHQGKANESVLDDSIKVNTKTGTCSASISGVLKATPLSISISNTLEIKGDVDFSTGRIVFPGKVRVSGAVRDRFGICATDDVHIDGLVEVAKIKSESSIALSQGMAGKESGTIQADQNLDAGYLESVIGEVGGNVSVKKEITNSQLVIRGELIAEKAAIRGGRLQIAKQATVGSIGSVQGVGTELVIGSLPVIEQHIHTGRKFLEEIEAAINTKYKKMESIKSVIIKPTPAQIEDQMGMEFEIQELTERQERLKSSRAQLLELIAQHTIARMLTKIAIYSKSVIYLPGYRIQFTKDVLGESVIELDSAGHPILTLQGSSVDLKQYAQINLDDTVLKVAGCDVILANAA